MNLLETLLSEQAGPAVGALADQFGLSSKDTKNALSGLIPSLTQGIGQNTAASGGVESLMKALQSGGHQKFLDQPNTLASQATTDEGNSILGHILGSKETSRAVAKNVSAQTGLGEDLLKKMLPIVATMAMGALSKKTQEPGLGSMMGDILGGKGEAGADLGALGSILGIDSDNAAESVIGLASKFLKR